MSKGYHDSKTPVPIRDLWRTPQAVFDYYDKRFNFEWDLAASKKNNLCRSYCSEVTDSAFEQSNRGFDGPVFCNPPYSDIIPWVELCIDISIQSKVPVIMLIPSDTSVKWFKLAFENCTECHFISGRLSFINEETGKPVSGNNKGSVVFVFDPNSQFKSQVCLIDRSDIMNNNR